MLSSRPGIALRLALASGLWACADLEVAAPRDPALVRRVQELEAERRARPNDLQLTVDLALAMHAAGDLFGAAEVMKSASEQHPTAAEPLLGLHRVYSDLGYGFAAYRALETCVEKNPAQPECVYRLASFLLLQDGSEFGLRRARDLFQRFLELAPDHPQAAIVRDALARMEESLGPSSQPAGGPSSRPQEGAPVADPHAGPGGVAGKIPAHEGAAGQEVGALNPFGQAIAEAMRAADRQDAPAAEAAFRRALGFEPGDTIALAGLAEALFSQGKLEEAVATVEKAYAADANEPIVQFVFGVIMVKGQRDPQRGVEAWKKLKAAQPDYAEKLGVSKMLEEAAARGIR